MCDIVPEMSSCGMYSYLEGTYITSIYPLSHVCCDSDMEYAECMRHVLTAVDSSDLVALLEQTRLSSEEQAGHADSEAAGQLTHCLF